MSTMSTLITAIVFLLPLFWLMTRRRGPSSRKRPPGSLGIPIIAQSIRLLQAMRANTAEQWLQDRVREYGPISKLTLFGKPTMFIHGQVANKFVSSGSSGGMVSSGQTSSIQVILGDRNLLELSVEDHKGVRDSLVTFLRPESLKQYVGNMDREVRKHLELDREGKDKIAVLPLMRLLTFSIICSLLFGMEERDEREKFLQSFQEMIEVKNAKPEQKLASPHQDLVTSLLSKRNENGRAVMTEKEILHNIMIVMVAGHDTLSVLITFMLRFLSIDPMVYNGVLEEKEEIAKGKTSGEPLTWEDLARMKYTWRVAMETMRMFPPIFGGFRVALKDSDYGGYVIPKGWQNFWATNMTHMDYNILPEPSKFDPSRFENLASVPPYYFVPFGGGPRLCPGNEFARIETLVAIHHLITRYSRKLCSDLRYKRDPMPVPTQGLLFQIVPKKTN